MSDRIDFGRLKATADAATWQYHFVAPHTTADEFTIATGGSNPAALGVLQNDPRSGEAGNVRVIGPTKVYGDATSTAIGVRDFITAGSNGMAVVGSGSAVYGIALQALSSGASVLIDVLLTGPNVTVADNTP